MVRGKLGIEILPSFLPVGALESRIDFGERYPANLGDLGCLGGKRLLGLSKLAKEKDNFFVDIAVGDVVRKTVTDGGVDSDIEAGFFFNFTNGGLELGLARFDVAFGETPVIVGLMFE